MHYNTETRGIFIGLFFSINQKEYLIFFSFNDRFINSLSSCGNLANGHSGTFSKKSVKYFLTYSNLLRIASQLIVQSWIVFLRTHHLSFVESATWLPNLQTVEKKTKTFYIIETTVVHRTRLDISFAKLRKLSQNKSIFEIKIFMVVNKCYRYCASLMFAKTTANFKHFPSSN